MKVIDFTTTILVDKTPQEAFESIHSVAKWWTEDLKGSSQEMNDEFTVHFGETYITSKVVEFIPYRKIIWLVTDCNKHWLKNKKEWKETKMVWEISAEKNVTQINFTHIGLIPEIECYNVCEKAWNFYVNESLFKLLTQGKGKPDKKVQ